MIKVRLVRVLSCTFVLLPLLLAEEQISNVDGLQMKEAVVTSARNRVAT